MQRLKIFYSLAVMVLLYSCNSTKFVADDELLLTKNTIHCSNREVNVSNLQLYLQQQPNSKWFSSVKVPLAIYSLSGADSAKFVNRLLKKWGEEPIILDNEKIEMSSTNLRTAVQNMGYLDAKVTANQIVKGKKAKVDYVIDPGEKYVIRHLIYNIADQRIDSLMSIQRIKYSGLYPGMTFSVNTLQEERKHITSWLNNQGYLYFNKEAITFIADSCQERRFVDVTMNIGLYRSSSNEPLRNHPYYTIRNVSFVPAKGQQLNLRQRTLDINTLLEKDEPYQSTNVQKTYNKFSRLHAVRSTNIHFTEVADSMLSANDAPMQSPDNKYLDAVINITRRKPNSIKVLPEGTNTSGDFGAALSLTYENRNVFHGSEVFTLQGRAAFEAIKGLEGYNGSNYEEYGIEGKLSFPEFLMPGVSRSFQRRHTISTEVVASYNRQNRPEFHRRVFNAAWRYRWQSSNSKLGYLFDFLDVDYVSMPWISDTFKRNYLDSDNSRNAILRYNYENILIMKIGFGFTYNGSRNSLKANVETAGNTLYGLSSWAHASQDDEGKYKFARVAFAQYVKVDVDYTHLMKLDTRNSLALHARVGVGVPYGNSTMMPFEKRYFSGGANSVRGWSVRELGPGCYRGTDGRIDFINQMGDFKVDLNAELRTYLFWKFNGALFVDAGNIWTLRRYDDQPGGMFQLRNIYDELAVAYGVGLRLNFDYFILRLDLGMKAVNPVYNNSHEHFPLIHPKFNRDYALHFAVGLPF